MYSLGKLKKFTQQFMMILINVLMENQNKYNNNKLLKNVNLFVTITYNMYI